MHISFRIIVHFKPMVSFFVFGGTKSERMIKLAIFFLNYINVGLILNCTFYSTKAPLWKCLSFIVTLISQHPYRSNYPSVIWTHNLAKSMLSLTFEAEIPCTFFSLHWFYSQNSFCWLLLEHFFSCYWWYFY